MTLKRIGVLTGGGDAPGLNAVIRGIVYAAEDAGVEVIGIRDGWKGMLEQLTFEAPLTRKIVSDWVLVGGTLLGSSRTNPYKDPQGPQKVKTAMKSLSLDGLVAIGGDDTLGVARKLANEGVNVVGVPKTIDNDVGVTDYCLGFDTAANIAADAIQALHTTARSHHRVIVVEVMGRHAGWITLVAGIAGNAHAILIPEKDLDLEEVCNVVQRRMKSEQPYAIIAVSEGVTNDEIKERVKGRETRDQFGNVFLAKLNIGKELADIIKERTGTDTRFVVLGHLQRSGVPSAFDRFLGTRLGVKAFDLLKNEKYGYMAVLRGTQILDAKIAEGVSETRIVDEANVKLTELLQS
ncbi:MAG: 6-phosphofructokinase [Candidatus Ranarchaeia archaeon]